MIVALIAFLLLIGTALYYISSKIQFFQSQEKSIYANH